MKLSSLHAHSRTRALASLVLGTMAVGDRLTAQDAVTIHSTHDWTPVQNAATDTFREAWADAKSPGDGLTYAVGSIEIRDNVNNPFFSPTGPNPLAVRVSPAMTAFTQAALAGNRQVVILQATNADQAIVWQSYFYGAPFLLSERPCNARGISVWSGMGADGLADPNQTRIAICGESFDDLLPLSQDPAGSAIAAWKGIIAVFNGNGLLMWSHHFFGTQPGNHCAITDVSIRVVDGQDVVTYCGITSHGNPQNNAWLAPLASFPAPITATCTTPASGANDNGAGQWDGLVGRLTNNTLNPVTAGVSNATQVFQSIVGGQLQDGLFGIDEIDANRFVVVGSTGTGPNVAAGGGGATFPFTTPVCANLASTEYQLGVFMVFDATAVPGPLQLEFCGEIGSYPSLGDQPCGAQGAPQPPHTIARDVVVQRSWNPADANLGDELVVVVGSTDDCNLLNSTLNQWPLGTGIVPAPQFPIGGDTDGFVFCWNDLPTQGWSPKWVTFRGGANQDGLTGVQSWNEYVDHFTVAGFTEVAADRDIEVASFYLDTSESRSLSDYPLIALRDGLAGGAGIDQPAAMGPNRATLAGGTFAALDFVTFDLGDPAGGGVCVDSNARVNVVGRTASGNYPVVGINARIRGAGASDAARTVFDMLPDGVGRTDGTGAPVPGGVVQYPLPGVYGGTTPQCAGALLGRRIGLPPPPLPRMLIDYEGPPPADALTSTVAPAILVDRPPSTGTFHLMALQFDFPGALPGSPGTLAPAILPEGVILWMTNNPQTMGPTVIPTGPSSLFRTLRFQLSALPNFGITMSVQAFGLVTPAVPGGNVGIACANPQGSAAVASPALWISY